MQSVQISREALIVAAAIGGGWLALALTLVLSSLRRDRRARANRDETTSARALLAAGPAIPLVVHADGRLEGGERLAPLLGLETLPPPGSGLGLEPGDAERLSERIALARASGGGFIESVRALGSSRALAVRGGPAPRPWRAGSILLWFIDDSEAIAATTALRADAERAATALEALAGLIEAAPFPMWHRGPDLTLAMVNGAYVAAVEGTSAAEVVRAQTELIDAAGEEALAPTRQVQESGAAVARNVPATIGGQRRTIRVVEVPLGPAGVAGYAIDVEDREQARGDLARFVRAQRDMLDRLSAGVAQFDRNRTLAFFNQPFARMFSLSADFLIDQPEFDRIIEAMREGRNLPEVRDFPAWREERRGWFNAGAAAEEDWLLSGGRHLRVVAQPLPDGGLVLILEDRTEQIQLASSRDTLLRVRTATFDNLFEAVGVFASDGRLNLWNKRFGEVWQFDEATLAAHPRIDALLGQIGSRLKNSRHAGLVRELVRTATIERKQRSGRVSMIDGRDFEFAAVPLPDGNALFTMLDVTDSRKIEGALRERNQALEQADRVKTAFVSNISYELRTPLTSIAGFAEMLDGGYAGSLEPAAADYVKAILDAVARLGSLIDDVLDTTQGDGGKLAFIHEEVDLAALCEESAEVVAEEERQRGVTIGLDVSPAAGLIAGDRRRVRQVLVNMLRSAAGRAPDGGTVTLAAGGDAREATILIADDGMPIGIEDRAALFDRFGPAEGGSSDLLGLNLPIARRFVEAHGGAITVGAGEGGRTEIVIRLPRRPA